MNRRTVFYWLATGFFCLVFVMGGLGNLSRASPQLETMRHLGYPDYMMTLLGVAMFLGVIALLAPGFPILKEWAYAGFAFDLLGATASHVAVGDSLVVATVPLVILAVGAASYFLRPASRRLAAA